jgi:hypothetical protein
VQGVFPRWILALDVFVTPNSVFARYANEVSLDIIRKAVRADLLERYHLNAIDEQTCYKYNMIQHKKLPLPIFYALHSLSYNDLEFKKLCQ